MIRNLFFLYTRKRNQSSITSIVHFSFVHILTPAIINGNLLSITKQEASIPFAQAMVVNATTDKIYNAEDVLKY